ncbi:MAG: type I-E CRISPR-associated protein Cas6/Cse3/CasE [Candidatus Helarchaeota archaeon]
MFLSKLNLNPESARVRKELANPYQLHRTLMTGFADNLKESHPDFHILFKVNNKPYRFGPTVLVQSTLRPNWNSLLTDNSFLLNPPAIKEFKYPPFREGAIYQFQLWANPTKKTNGKRVGMYNEEEQFQWLKRKAESGGFKILLVGITRKETIKAKANKKSPTLTFQGVQFEGVLRILDRTTFSQTLKQGIGSGKAFGFGFLTISKLYM